MINFTFFRAVLISIKKQYKQNLENVNKCVSIFFNNICLTTSENSLFCPLNSMGKYRGEKTRSPFLTKKITSLKTCYHQVNWKCLKERQSECSDKNKGDSPHLKLGWKSNVCSIRISYNKHRTFGHPHWNKRLPSNKHRTSNCGTY